MTDKVRTAKLKVWSVFIVLFVCGVMVGVGIANWNRLKHQVITTESEIGQIASDGSGIRGALTNYVGQQKQQEKSECQAVEDVLLGRLFNDDNNCRLVRQDLGVYNKLLTFGCDDNHERYSQEMLNKQAILAVACSDYADNLSTSSCVMIEQTLRGRYNLDEDFFMSAEERISRAKVYALMAERGCPENAGKYTEAAKRELEIARGISDDKFTQDETVEVVETYKRLKMQQEAEIFFNNAKKLTEPAIDFIMKVEKIINE